MYTEGNDIPFAPTLFAEICFCFDYDFQIDELDGILNLHPTDSMRFSQTRINPISRKHNYGYWLIRSNGESCFDCESLVHGIEILLKNKTSSFQKMIHKYRPCYSMLRIIVHVKQENEYPVIRMNPELLILLSSLGMSVDIDIENDYSF